MWLLIFGKWILCRDADPRQLLTDYLTVLNRLSYHMNKIIILLIDRGISGINVCLLAQMFCPVQVFKSNIVVLSLKEQRGLGCSGAVKRCLYSFCISDLFQA